MPGFAGYVMANEILNLFYRGVSPTIGATLYLRLLVSASSRDGGGTETTYSGYARLALPRDTSLFGDAPANGRLNNTAALVFPTALSAGNGDIVAFDIVDSASGAFTKIYNGGPVSPAKTIEVNKPPRFSAGRLAITF